MKEHEIVIPASTKLEKLTESKFRSIGYIDEEESSTQLVNKQVGFRGSMWKVRMACQQLSLDHRIGWVRKHPEPDEVELIATVWGAQRVRVWGESNERIDEMHGPLTEHEASEASYQLVESEDSDLKLKITHEKRGTFVVPFSITMPTESHQTAYSRNAGCIAIKMTPLTTSQV